MAKPVNPGQLMREARALFQRCRNLGEDLAEVLVLDAYPIEVGGQIHIAADADPARLVQRPVDQQQRDEVRRLRGEEDAAALAVL